MSRRIPWFLLSLALIACESSVAPDPTDRPSQTQIGVDGGTLEAATEDGAQLRIEFPAGAVVEPTDFSLKATTPNSGDLARFTIHPAGLLRVPVTIELEMPADWSLGARPGFHFGSAASPTYVLATFDSGARTLSFQTQYLGYPALPAVAARKDIDGVGDGDEPEPTEDELTDALNVGDIECSVLLNNMAGQIQQAQLYQFSIQPVDQLIKEFKLLQAECENELGADFQDQVAFLETVACAGYAEAIINAESVLPATTAAELSDRVCSIMSTQAIKNVVVAECGDDFEDAVAEQFAGYIQNIEAEVTAPGYISGVGPWDTLWGQLHDVLKVLAAAHTLDVVEAQQLIENDLLPLMLTVFREAAYAPCLGEFHTQQYLADLRIAGVLMNHPIGSGTALPDWAPFTQEELEEDLQWCGSELDIAIFEAVENQPIETVQLIGGTAPGESEHEVSIDVPADGFIELSGPIRALFCIDPLGGNTSFSQDTLVIQADGETLGTLNATAGVFLTSPFDISVEQTLELLGLPADGSEGFTLRIVRQGDVCQGLYGSPTFELFRVDVNSEGCPVGKAGCQAGFVIATSQAEINALAGITHMERLRVGSYEGPTDIVDLSPLASLQVVEQSVEVDNNPSLASLSGLDALREVPNLVVQTNESLTNLVGLGGLEVVASVSISNNANLVSLNGLVLPPNSPELRLSIFQPALTDLAALSGLTSIQSANLSVGSTDFTALSSLASVDGSISITRCPNLTSLDGLQGLALNGVTIQDNPSLTTIAALSSVVWPNDPQGQHVRVQENPVLTSLQGLESLTTMWDVFIQDNSALTNLQGLDNLESVTHIFLIQENENLASLAGLESLVDGSLRLSITNNPNLTSVGVLSGLQNSDLSLELIGLPALSNLSGIQNLTMESFQVSDCDQMTNLGLSNCVVTQGIQISGNELLQSVDGLTNTTSLDVLQILDNPSFVSLAGLASLQTVTGNVEISNNVSLDNCAAEAFAAAINVGGTTTVGSNGPCEE